MRGHPEKACSPARQICHPKIPVPFCNKVGLAEPFGLGLFAVLDLEREVVGGAFDDDVHLSVADGVSPVYFAYIYYSCFFGAPFYQKSQQACHKFLSPQPNGHKSLGCQI